MRRLSYPVCGYTEIAFFLITKLEVQEMIHVNFIKFVFPVQYAAYQWAKKKQRKVEENEFKEAFSEDADTSEEVTTFSGMESTYNDVCDADGRITFTGV